MTDKLTARIEHGGILYLDVEGEVENDRGLSFTKKEGNLKREVFKTLNDFTRYFNKTNFSVLCLKNSGEFYQALLKIEPVEEDTTITKKQQSPNWKTYCKYEGKIGVGSLREGFPNEAGGDYELILSNGNRVKAEVSLPDELLGSEGDLPLWFGHDGNQYFEGQVVAWREI